MTCFITTALSFVIVILTISSPAADTVGPSTSATEAVPCEEAQVEAGLIASDESVVAPAELPLALICAAEAFVARGKLLSAERMLLRALAVGGERRDLCVIERSLLRLGAIYEAEDEDRKLLEVWEQWAELALRFPEMRAPLGLLPGTTRLAETLYRQGELRRSKALVSRVEGLHGGEGYGLLIFDPVWLPDLYASLGDLEAAERIHEQRMAAVAVPEISMRRAIILDHYAEFLRAHRSAEKAAEVRESAASIREHFAQDDRERNQH